MQNKSDPHVHPPKSCFIGIIATVLFAVCMSVDTVTQSRESESSERLRRLEESVSRLEGTISELASLLRAALPPPPVTELSPTRVDISTSQRRGESDAPVALIEYSDFECPFCGRHAADAYLKIQRNFVETGKVQYIFRHSPLEQLHPRAKKAAEAAECAGEQGSFWEYHDQLFANQSALTNPDLSNYARTLKLLVEAFDSCLNSGKMSDKVEGDLVEAKRLGVNGTPAFLFGEIQDDGSVTATRRVVGSHPFAVYETVLNELLREIGIK